MADILWFIEQGWKAIWKQNTIWIFSVLPVVIQFIGTPQSDGDINLFPLIIAFTLVFLYFVSFIGVDYLAYCFLIGKPATVKETLSAVRKFVLRVIGCSCLVILVLSPCFLLLFAISMGNTTRPPQISDNAILVWAIFFSLFGAMLDFSMFGFFANNSGIRQTLRDAWALFTAHFGVLVTLGLILTILISIFNAASGMLTLLIQSGFDITSLSQLNYINPSESLSDNLLFLFLSGIGQTIYAPFSASIFALAYLKYSRIKTPLLTRQNQPKTSS